MADSTETKSNDVEDPGKPLSIAGRGKLLLALLALGVVADLVSAAVDASHLSLINDLLENKDVSFEDAQASDDRVGITALVVSVLYVLTIIAFLSWFYRAYSNLPRLGLQNLRYKRGWSIGAWFIPILNLFRPKQIANDIWRGSDPGPEFAPQGRNWHAWPVSGLLHWWWAAWLISGWFSGRAFSTDFQAGTLDEQKTSTTLYITSDMLNVIAGILALLVVRAITARQQRRIDAQSD